MLSFWQRLLHHLPWVSYKECPVCNPTSRNDSRWRRSYQQHSPTGPLRPVTLSGLRRSVTGPDRFGVVTFTVGPTACEVDGARRETAG